MKQTTCIFHSVLVAAGLFGSAAIADEKMNTAQISALIAGNTLYVDMPAGAPGAPDGGTAPIFFESDGSASALLPAGRKLVGAWRLEDGSYCVDWDNGPKNSCTQIVRGAVGFIVTDASRDEPRGVITRIATGNAENL